MKLKVLACVAATGAGLGMAALTVEHLFRAADMPPLAGNAEVYKFYRLEFLPDGFPGRRTDDGLIPHPIYGTYVIGDYIRQFRATQNPIFLQAAETVANSALKRMEMLPGGGLAFYYDPASGLTGLDRHYSGLTQARYLGAFSSLWLETKKDVYLKAAERVLASLRLPVSEGGVSLRAKGGLVIEEWPDQVGGNYTLNGWTTALLIIHDYYERTGSSAAKKLFDQNILALRELLPLYDLPELANTRYRLSGSARIRIDGIEASQVKNAKLVIPGVGASGMEPAGKGKWKNYFLPSNQSGTVEMHAVLNMISAPKPNKLEMSIETESSGEVEFWIGQGPFDPSTVDLPVKEFRSFSKIKLTPGKNSISIEIPWEYAPLVAYPTAFNKKIGGETHNVYHFLHVNNISDLATVTGDPLLLDYANTWKSYTLKWDQMPVYAEAGVSFNPVPD